VGETVQNRISKSFEAPSAKSNVNQLLFPVLYPGGMNFVKFFYPSIPHFASPLKQAEM
jgi:hypothetical protein